MKLKNYSQFFVIIFLLCVTNLFSQSNQPKQNQDLNPFAEIMGKGVNAYGTMTPRLPGFGNFIKIKGDVAITGNQIINRTTENNAGTASGDVRPILDASGQPTNLPALTTRANANYGGNLNNDRLNFEYVDVDSDGTTFSSSTANLLIRDSKNGTISPTNCKKIVYAALYWTAYYPYERIANTYNNAGAVLTSTKYPIINNNWNQVKFKVPGGTYQTLTADTNADAVGDEDDISYRGTGYLPINGGPSPFANNSAYVCYKNVTSLVSALADANGTYAVADMVATRGNDPGGLAGGWSLVVVFESPSYPLKYISVADGFKILYNDTGNAANRRFDFTLSGLKTLSSGPVNARIGVAALDGDRNDVGDIFQIKNTAGNYVNVSNSNNQSQPDYANNNFFSSNITLPDAFPSKASNGITKTPNNSNTLGFDLDLVNVFNPGSTTIGNNQSSVDVRIETNNEDFCPYLSTFSVDIAEAKIILTKVIKKTNGTLVANNGTVALGEQLNYVIGFQNVGTADATNTVITDVLPANVIFDQTAFTASLPAGVTFTSYNTTTRLLTLAVANNLVEKNGFRTEFNIEILVEKECSKFANACANLIVNNAQISYFDVANAVQINNQNSCNVFNTAATCPLDPTTGTTNFKVDTSTCVQNRTEVMCNGNLLLTAPTGYTSYAWSQTSPTTATLGTGATQNVTSLGTYQVVCTPVAGCDPVTVIFKVFDFILRNTPDPLLQYTIPHPVNPFSDTRVSCTNDGIVTEIIALCGASDSRLITTGITTASSITWQIKNTTGCPGPTVTCPNTDSTCYTNTGQTGPNFLADTAGDYRVVIAYNGASNCTLNFHFRVTKGSLNATAISKDISCTNPGAIIVNGVPLGYEYQLQGPYPATTLTPWQDSNTFSIPISNPGTYKAFIRTSPPLGNTCVYIVPNISVLKLNLQSAVKVFNPSCNLPPATPTGSVTVKVIDGTAPFLYYIRNGADNNTGVFVASANSSNVQETFSGLAAGNYTAQILISGGTIPLCSTSQNFTITVPTPLDAKVGLNKPYTFCSPGVVQVNITAGSIGTPPYLYYMDSLPAQYSNLFTIGDTNPHTFKIVDANGCTFTTKPYTMVYLAAPTFTVTQTNIVCDPQSGAFTVNPPSITNGFNFTYLYNGTGIQSTIYTANPTNANLVADVYKIRVKCTIGTSPNDVTCFIDLPNVTITSTYPPLTATGGVSGLAGCDPDTVNFPNNGEIRITNPQGGSGILTNYLYSFDNDVTYQTANFKLVQPAIYDIYIKDIVTGCKFKMKVTLEPRPTPPTIAVVNSTFNCDGTANSVVTITNDNNNFLYTYLINYNLTPNSLDELNPNGANSNIFLNVPCGPIDKTIVISYIKKEYITYSNLLDEDFGVGSNTPLPNNTIASAYCYNSQPAAPAPPIVCPRVGNPTYATYALEDGQYVVTRAINPNNGQWWPVRDHTSAPTVLEPTKVLNPNGRFLAINIGAAAGSNGILYEKKIYDVIPLQKIIVEAYVTNLIKNGSSAPHDPGFTYEITTSTGVLLKSTTLNPTLPRNSAWIKEFVELDNVPANTLPYLIFRIRSASIEYQGNDTAIDDIKVYQIPKSCVTVERFPLIIKCDKAFTASVTNVKNVGCFGEKTASITITAENFVSTSPPNNSFEYSVTGPTGPWYTSTVSPVVLTAASLPLAPPGTFGAGTIDVVVRYNNSTLPCNVKILTTITEPTDLSVTATKTDATCLTGGKGSIEATPVGGVAPFQYQLLNSSLAVVPGFGYGSANINNGTGLISNVNPGTYFVQIQDANLCTKDAFASVTISGTTDPQPVIAATSDLCYDTINQAKLIVDVPTGGLPPFTYSIVPAATFIGNSVIVTPGTYTITVTDANGCKGFINSLTIRPALSLNLSLNKDLDCTTPTPEGIIRGTISGGVTSYTYQVSTDNGVTYGTAIPVTTNPFNYNVLASGVPISGAIKIKVTDGAGCTAESTINISPRDNVSGTATPTIATCGANNGTVTLLATAGAPGFTYSFNNSDFTGTTSYPDLAPNTYPFKIRDSKSCEFPGTVTVGASVVITGAASFTTGFCTPNSTIEFTGMPTNSVALGYQYSIKGGSSFQSSPFFPATATGNLSGTYVCIIKDANGCTKPNTLNIPAFIPPTDIAFEQTNTICTGLGNSATVKLTVSPTIPIVKYETIVPSVAIIDNDASNVFLGLASGSYTFQVTDSNGCKINRTFVVNPPVAIAVSGQLLNDVACKGSATGKIRFNVSAFTPGTYSYSVVSTVGATTITSQVGQTATSFDLSFLLAGTYTITVTSSATGCKATDFVEAKEAGVLLDFAITNTLLPCVGSASITATVVVGSGIPGYTYVLDQPTLPNISQVGNGVFTGLTVAGTYTLFVTDVAGCTVSKSVTLTTPVIPIVAIDNTTTCVGTSGTASVLVTITGLNTPFKYSLDGSTFDIVTSNPFTISVSPQALPHTIIVKDVLECSSAATTFTVNPKMTITSVLTPLKCDSSGATVAAVIAGTVTNGYPGYGYQVYYSATLPVLPIVATAFSPTVPVAFAAPNYSFTTANGYGYYVLRFTDSRGCTADSNIIQVLPLIAVSENSPTVVNVICNGDATGSITVNPTGGIPPYKVDFGSDFGSSLSYSGLTAANPLSTGTTYNYTIKDSNGCLYPGSATVKNLYDKITYVTDIIPLQCVAGVPSPANGKICISGISGGLPPYTYFLTANNTQTFPSVNTSTLTNNDYCFEFLEYGIFDFTVVDANNCSFNSNIKIAAPPDDLKVDATTFPTLSCAPNSGVIIVKATSPLLLSTDVLHFAIQQNPALAYPNPPFWNLGTYTPAVGVDPAYFSYTFTGLTAGNVYDFVVHSGVAPNDCYYTATASSPVSPYSKIKGIPSPNAITCSGSVDASVNLTVKNYTGTSLTYEIFTSPFNGTVVGGGPFTLTGITPNVDFTIPNIGTLAPGQYSILMIEGSDSSFAGCQTKSDIFTIAGGGTLLTLTDPTFTNDNCNVNAGTITASASGGSGGFKYRITPDSGIPSQGIYSTSSIFNVEGSLLGTTYTVDVKDATGCVKSKSVKVFLTPNPTVVLSTVSDQCNSTGSSYSFTATGAFGIAPYSYSIGGSTVATSATGLPAVTITVNNSGTYIVTITDAKGCTGTASLTIYSPITLTANEVIATTCPTNNNGQIKATATGGSGSFTYSIFPALAGFPNATGLSNNNITAGVNYEITATDNTTGCEKKFNITLNTAIVPTFTLGQTPVNCNDSANGNINSNGTITATLSGTLNTEGPYTYQIVLPFLGTLQTGNNVFTGLTAQSYTIRVTSIKGCSFDDNITVQAPILLSASASVPAPFACTPTNATSTTSLTISASGGVGGNNPANYTYKIDGTGFLTTNVFNNIPDTGAPQTINYFVKDANGCIATGSVLLNPLTRVTATVALQPLGALTCTTGEQVIVNATSGSGNYIYEWQGSGLPASGTNTFSLTNAGTTPITYTFKVTDNITSCSTTATYVVNPLPELKVTFPSKTDITCFGGTGSLTFAVSGYSGAYQYEVFETSNLVTPVQSITAANTSSPTITVSNLLAGNYIVKIQESAAPDCSLTSGSITIVQPTELKINLVNKLAAFCTSGGARVTVIGQGGTPGYSYVFVQDNVVVNNATVFGLSASVLLDPALNLNWDVYVKDADGCISAKLDVAIIQTDDPILTLPLFADNKCDTSGSNYLITATAIGSGTLTYLIGNNVVTNPITVPIPTAINDLEITVKDANGCIDRVIIRLYPALVFTAGITTYANCIPAGATPTGVITMTSLGGSGNLVVSLSPLTPSATAVITGNVISAIAPGTYTIVLTDTKTNCTREVDVIMPTPTPVTLDPISKSDATCFGGTNGTITVNLATLPNGANNDPVYQYALFSSTNPLTPIRPNQTNKTFLDLAAGDYVIEVTSLKGCKLTQPVIIGQPNEIVVNVPTVQQFACTTTNIGNFASITVNPITGVTGGASIYTIYEFSNASGIVQSGTSNFIDIIDLAGGTYTVKVFDIKGCSGVSAPIVIAPFIKIDDATVSAPTPITCSSLTENIQVNVPVNLPSGITTPPTLTYVINGVFSTVYTATNNSGAFNNLPIGQYQITITTTTPNTGCFVKVNHTVVDPRVYQAIVKDIKPVACKGDSTGSATIYMINSTVFDTPVGSNLVGPFTCIIKDALGNQVGATLTSTGLGSVTATGLPKGIYTAELVLNGNSCPATFDFGISEPEFSLSVTAVKGSEVGCSPKTGSILVTVSGGTQFIDGINPPYLVTLINTTNLANPGPFPGNANSLEAGNYQVFVTDANGCTDNSRFVVLGSPTAINIAPSDITILPVNCFNDSTTIIVRSGSITGGSGSNYLLYWYDGVPSNGVQSIDSPTSNYFLEAGYGTYYLIVKDDLGCTQQFGPFDIVNPTEIAPTLTIQTQARCGFQAILELGATGGTGPYTYSSDGGLTYSTTPFATSVLITTVANQLKYIYIVKDFNGCIKGTEITPPVFDPITLKSSLIRNITCFGGNDGKISVTAQGGYDIDYSYSIATVAGAGAPLVPVNTTGIFDNLAFGNYWITVTSTNSCVVEFPFTLTQPLEFIVKVTPKTVKCFSDTNGELVLEIQNAIGNLQYAISSITDPTTANQFVNIPPSAIIKLSSNPDVFGIRYVISGLAPNSYFLEVKDAANCPFNPGISFVVSEPSELISKASDALILQEELCKFDANASFSIKIFGGTAPYTVSLDNAGTGTYFVTNDGFVINPPAGGLPAITVYSHIFSGLVGGVHKVYVVDANGCRVSYDITLGLPVFINPIATISYPCPEDAPGILNRLLITVDSSINLVDVKFKIDLGSFLPSNNSLGYLIENLSVGTHTFEVLHTNGCRKSGTFEIKFVDPLVLKLTEGNLNQIIAIATGGVAPYNYTFNDTNTGFDNTYIYDKTGKYTVTVIDNSNCKLTVSKQFNFIDIFIPNFFSPNGDGENDGWSPQNTYNYKNLVFYVFDRYGRKIISLKEGESWDGKYDGQELPTGDYWYIVKTEESSTREFVGNFTLYR